MSKTDSSPEPGETPTPEPVEAEIVDDAVGEDLDDMQSQMAELTEQVASLTDKLARARADYQNLQRRVERDAALERERAKARVLEGFLTVFEYGQMAATEAEKSPGPLAEGVKMVVREFERLIESEGVQQFAAVGEAFDASLHEAVEELAVDGIESGHITRVIRPGYRLGERIMRHAKVAVAPAES